jgi:hypothetical protein
MVMLLGGIGEWRKSFDGAMATMAASRQRRSLPIALTCAQMNE